jgi:type II secretory pathway component PulC
LIILDSARKHGVSDVDILEVITDPHMNSDVEVIWRRGDAEMPEKVKHVVEAAKDELLLRSLQLPFDAVDIIRYNASKSDKSINEYISSLVLGSIMAAQP